MAAKGALAGFLLADSLTCSVPQLIKALKRKTAKERCARPPALPERRRRLMSLGKATALSGRFSPSHHHGNMRAAASREASSDYNMNVRVHIILFDSDSCSSAVAACCAGYCWKDSCDMSCAFRAMSELDKNSSDVLSKNVAGSQLRVGQSTRSVRRWPHSPENQTGHQVIKHKTDLQGPGEGNSLRGHATVSSQDLWEK